MGLACYSQSSSGQLRAQMRGDKKRLLAWAGAASLVTPLILGDSQAWLIDVGTFLLFGIMLHVFLNVSLVWIEEGIGTVMMLDAHCLST